MGEADWGQRLLGWGQWGVWTEVVWMAGGVQQWGQTWVQQRGQTWVQQQGIH